MQSPHFRIISDGSEKEVRRVLREFEQIRSVFARMLPNAQLESGIPLLIVATNDERSVRLLVPDYWKKTKFSGFFSSGWEKEIAVVRLDEIRRANDSQIASSAFSVVYHEYAHTIMRANFRWMPLWLSEGLAEFYGNSRFLEDQVQVGAPNPRAKYVDRPLYSIEKLLSITRNSREYDDSVETFYYQSWGLVHFLQVSPQMDQGKKLAKFLTFLDQGIEQKEAFRKAFGEMKDLDVPFGQYLARNLLPTYALPNPPDIQPASFRTRKMNAAETASELGTVQLWLNERAAAKIHIEDALKADPRSAIAHQAMGFLLFEQGNDTEAEAELRKASELDDSLYLSSYYRTMLSPLAHSDKEEDRRALRAALESVVLKAPSFAAARIELAKLSIREGNLNAALAYTTQARRLAPSRAGYITLAANILYGLGRHQEAEQLALFVADRWEDPDRDEALDLLDRIPVEARKDARTYERRLPPEEKSVSGKITSLACTPNMDTIRISIDGVPMTFSAKTLSGGMSDTLWYGGDHFSFCHHVEGFNAVLHFKPTSGNGDPAITQFAIRDNISMRSN